tara:strand:- start:35 stop:205 length:171 start_codon:yes stop_codon:yes gene_type:complete
LLETEYGAYQGALYCLAVTFGGQAIQIALWAAGVKPGDKILDNAVPDDALRCTVRH